MNTKEFTLQKGLILPILKSLAILNKESSIVEIAECMQSKNLFIPREGDLERIDFNDKMRFVSAVESAIQVLTGQGLISQISNLFTITEAGTKKLELEWTSYNQSNYIKVVNIASVNKYVYFNMPPYLLHSGQKQLTVLGFNGHEREYIKFLNDFIDYIDLNYPLMDEMINFLKFTYDFESQEACLNTINIIRSCGLVKVMGKNLSLTKLGQWYINSYSNIALFRIFANRFLGFEEILNIIALNNNITISKLNQIFSDQSAFSWANPEQIDSRLHWLEDMEIVTINNNTLSLTKDAISLSEYLGFIDIASDTNTGSKVVETSYSMIETKDDLIESIIEESNIEDFNLSEELNSIVADIVPEASHIDESDFLFESDLSKIQVDRNTTPDSSSISLDDIFSESSNKVNPQESVVTNDNMFNNTSQTQDSIEIIAEEEKPDQVPLIFNISNDLEEQEVCIDEPTQLDNHDYKNEYISPDEISNLVNLPKDVAIKIVCALNMGKHIILTGPHGCGKTSIAVIIAKIAQQKKLCSGYNLITANESMSSSDAVGSLLEIGNTGLRKVFKEGFVLKSIRENKWLIVDEIAKCDTNKCFSDFINSFYGYNVILPYLNHNYKNIEIISESHQQELAENQYFKSKDWRIIATMDTTEKHDINFSPAFIRRFAFIEIGFNNYSKLIDEYFIKNNVQNDILKNKIKAIFSSEGLLKYKDIGASSIYDLIQYISIRYKLLSDGENIHKILAEGLELFILPQLRVLDRQIAKESQDYLLNLFENHIDIKEYIKKAL